MKSGKLYIRTKSGEIKQLILNFAQRIVLALIERRLKEGRPVRIRLLKARQLGFSTLFEAIIYAFTSRREGFHSLVISDDEEGSQELFEMNKLYHERLEEPFKPKLKKSNEIALEFGGLKSRIDIDTSRNKNAGRGSTIQIVHKSESSRFHFPKEVDLGVANAVPDLPGTMIFDETTANGMNFYYDKVQGSIKGVDGFDFVFIPWVMNPEYSMPAPPDMILDHEEREIVRIAAEGFVVVYDGENIKHKIQVTNEMLSWRRYAIVHKCGGDIDQFRQEYPLTVEEAFIYSGRPRFDVNILRKIKGSCGKPLSKDGLLDVYEPFDMFAKYVLGVDTSEGLASGDNSSVTILNCRTYSQAAHYSGKLAPDVLASYIKNWGERYNKALAVVESNNHGLVTLNFLKDIYKNIYYRKNFDNITNTWVEKIGFQTSARTKPLLIGNLDKALRSGLIVRAIQTADELLTYIIEDDGTTNAAEGKKDDSVISLALAVQGYLEINEKTLAIPQPAVMDGTVAKLLQMEKNGTLEPHKYEGRTYRS